MTLPPYAFRRDGKSTAFLPRYFSFLCCWEGSLWRGEPASFLLCCFPLSYSPWFLLAFVKEREAAFVPSGCKIWLCWGEWKFFFDLKAIRISPLESAQENQRISSEALHVMMSVHKRTTLTSVPHTELFLSGNEQNLIE